MTDRLKVLCVSDYYLPGFQGGGLVRTLANLRHAISDQIELCIFTRDRDLGADQPYADLPANQWLDQPQGPLFYASPDQFNAAGLIRAAHGQSFSLLYLNSFFSFNGSIHPCRKWRKQHPDIPILLAPRGEFSPGALQLKPVRKKLFISLMRSLGQYRSIYWHASTSAEAEDIRQQFPEASDQIHMAADPVLLDADALPDAHTPKREGHLRIAFISRISPKKNLDGLLSILMQAERPVHLSIYGPIEDQTHWQQCQAMIGQLPDHVTVTYDGTLTPDQVSPTFARHDLFAFPTHGENFGHVIFEALRAGTPVLLSDQTPWQTDAKGALVTLPLGDRAGWQHAIRQATERSEAMQQQLREAARALARAQAGNSQILTDNIRMFRTVASKGKF